MNAWLAKHPRVHMHFTSHLFFPGEPRRTLLRRAHRQSHQEGVFKNIRELEAAIREFIETRNGQPKPYVWTARARARDVLNGVRATPANSDSVHS